jgi:hypothetical protein
MNSSSSSSMFGTESLYSLRFGKRRRFGQDLSQTLGI